MYSLDQIRQSHSQKRHYDKQFPLNQLVVRPLSFYLTYLIIRVTDSPSRVAYLGLIIGLTGSLSWLWIPEWTVWPGLLLLMVFAVLDAVDGNIARVTGNVTYYGKFLDGVIGNVIESSYFLTLGAGLYRYDDLNVPRLPAGPNEGLEFFILAAAAVATTGKLLSSHIQHGYYAYSDIGNQKSSLSEDAITQTIQVSRYTSSWWYLPYLNLGAFNVQLLVLSGLSYFHRTELFLLFYASYYFSQTILFFVYYLHRAKNTLS